MQLSRCFRILELNIENSSRCVEAWAGKKGQERKKDFQIKEHAGKYEGVKHHDAIVELYSSLVCL